MPFFHFKLKEATATAIIKMSITIKQLEMLASHFHFNMDEARQVIGIEHKKRGKQTLTSNDTLIEKGHFKPKCVKQEKEKLKKSRGASGYNLFIREQGISFKNAGSAWKSLSDSERDNWNIKAKS